MNAAPGWCGATVATCAAIRPDDAAILTKDVPVGWLGFHRRIENMAGALHRHAVRPGTAGALLMRDGVAHLIATFALHRLGVPLLVLDPTEPADLNAGLARRVGTAFTLGAAADGAAAPTRFLAIEEQAGDDDDLPPPPGPDTVCLFARSSGTTGGVPKVAAISHRRQIARTLASQEAMPLGPRDRYFVMVSNRFSYGRNCTYRAVITGGGVVLPPPLRSFEGMMAAIRTSGATWTAATPHHLRRLVDAAGPAPLLPRLRVLCSTAALADGERRMVMERVSPLLFVMYGTNESGILAIADPDDIRRKPGTVGRPPRGMQAEAIDGEGRPLPAGEVGTLRFAGGPFPDEYLGGGSSGGGGFQGGRFEPGDIGLVDPDGYVFLRGRIDDVVNVGGRKVLPADVEACLLAHPAVAEVVVVALRDGRLGAIAVAVARTRTEVAPGTLLQFCRDRLGPIRAPQAVVTVDAIPATPLGKPDRRAVAALAAARLAPPPDGSP